MRNQAILAERLVNLRFLNDDVKTLEIIDKLASKHSCTRCNAMSKIVERLNIHDPEYLNCL